MVRDAEGLRVSGRGLQAGGAGLGKVTPLNCVWDVLSLRQKFVTRIKIPKQVVKIFKLKFETKLESSR